MRSALVAIALALALGASAGCSASPDTTPTTAGVATTAPNTERVKVCADARSVILQSTGRYTAAMSRAVAAGEAGDLAARDTAMAELRTAFRAWSTGLRTTAEATSDPQLQATLLAYAGAVDATIARVKSFADLDDILYTFDDQELDVMASQFADACP